MLLSSLASGGMAAFGKEAGRFVTAYQIVFIQNLFGALCLFPMILMRWGWSGFKTQMVAAHLLRDLAGTACFVLFFLAVADISLINAVLLLNTAPLLMPFVVWVWIRRRPEARIWWGVVVGFIGVVLILNPGASAFQPGMILGFLSGLLSAIAYVTVRFLNRTEEPLLINFYYFLVGSLLLLPVAIWQWRATGWWGWSMLIGNAVCVVLSLITVTWAFRLGRIYVLSALIYLAIIWSGILGWIFWGTIPTFLSAIGAILVILGGLLSIFLGKRPEKG